VEARLAFPGEFAGERTAFIGTLEKDKTSTATYNMKVSKDAPSKAYDFSLQTSYLDENGVRKIIEKKFEVYVSERGEIDIEIAGVTTSPTKLYSGKDFTLSVQVENVGKQDAKAVKVQLAAMKEFAGERTSFLGSLKQDDTSTAIFDLSVAKNAEPGSYDIEMQISYLDDRGIEHSERKHFSMAVTEAPKTIPYIWIGAGAVILLGLIYLVRRRRSE
ncbi:MAG: CARDB domain-containing protein, partial [Methanobacteriota archaeon]